MDRNSTSAAGRAKSIGNRWFTAGVVIGVAAVGVLMVWGRAYYGSAQAFSKGEESLRQNRWIQAITYFDRAVHWYAPLNPFVERSAAKLWMIGEMAEKNGDPAMAVAALNAIRSGFKAANGIFSPGREWIRKSEARIQQISSKKSGSPGSAPDTAIKKIAVPSPPGVFWTLVLEIGLFGWIGTIIRLIWMGRRKTRFQPDFFVWSGLLVFFYAMWIFGMMKA